ncbi:L,D-transpeptidase [Methylopila turkensis]|nr:L,D-transpeptidase [Methylopila turkensis]
MSNRIMGLLALGFGLAFAAPAQATVVAQISLSQQRMDVMVDGVRAYSWPVSTARRGYVTPTGSYRPFRTEKMWHSRKYDMSPMPYSVFFRGGYAVHGTTYVRSLGRPASHGCVRLQTANAAKLYALVQKKGMARSRIVITR